MQKNKLFLMGWIIIVLSACNSGNFYEKYNEIPEMEWEMDEPIAFHPQIQDTLAAHSLYIDLRFSTRYKMRNLFLFITTTAPSGISRTDTLEVMLADERGRWYGQGWGDIYHLEVPYKKYIRFPLTGEYEISITQGMREETLKYISDVGLRIEKEDLN